MQRPERNTENNARGYSLVEMLIVTAIVIILATVPVALLRRSRDRVHELDAVKALRTMSLAYENYWAQNGHQYPHYRLDHQITDEVRFGTAEDIWDFMNSEKLLPSSYSGHPHDEFDLLAKGYRFTIFPAAAGQKEEDGFRNSYAFAMMPYEDSPATRGLAVIRGTKFFTSFPTAVPRRMKGEELDGVVIYSFIEEE